MRKGIVVPVLLAVVAGCSEAPTATEPVGDIGVQAAGAGVTASATGSGIVAPGIRKFAFQANTTSSRTTGNAELTFPEKNVKINMTLDCLEVIGNQATMSGHIRNVRNSANFQPGDAVWFRVVDNGEPSVDDEITLVTFFFIPGPGDPGQGVSCTEEGPFPGLNTIQNGNVQVH